MPNHIGEYRSTSFGLSLQENEDPLLCIDQSLPVEMNTISFLHLCPDCSCKRAKEEQMLHPFLMAAEHTPIICRDMTVNQLLACGKTVMDHPP
jgi:hypothetical protein